MTLPIQIIFYIGQNILMLYIIITILNIYFKPKKQTIHMLFTYSSYILLGVLSHFLINTSWINVILTIILIYMLLTNYIGSAKRKIVMTCSLTTFMMIAEIMVIMVSVTLLGQMMSDVVFDEVTNSILIILYNLMLLIIVKAMSLYKKKNQVEEKFIIFSSLYVCIIPLCSICILYLFATMSLIYTISHYIIILICILIIFINIFFFILFDKLRLSEKMKYEYALLKSEAKNFSKLEQNANDTFEKIRTIKHNLKYHLLYLKSKTEEKSLQSLEDIGIILDTIIEDTLCDSLIEYTKNKSINRLLNYKLLSLDEIGIDFDIKVSINEDTHIDEISLYTIIGNALDNAVRNFDSSNSTMNSIIVRVISDGDNLFIKIANPYNKKLNFKDGIPVTDKQNRELHGIGLKSIRDLVEIKDGHIKVTTDDNMFNLEILLYEEIKYKNSYQD